MRKYYFHIVLSLLLFPGVLSAQDITKEMEKAYRFYSDQQNYKLEVKVTLKSTGTSLASENRRTIVYKKGDQYVYQTGNTEMLSGSTYVLMVDHDQKTITYRNISESEKKKEEQFYKSIGIQANKPGYDSIRYDSIETGRKYTIYSAGKIITKTDILFHQDNASLKKIEYTYNQKITGEVAGALITFEQQELDEKNGLVKFQKEKYIVMKGNNPVLTSQYAHYTLNLTGDAE